MSLYVFIYIYRLTSATHLSIQVQNVLFEQVNLDYAGVSDSAFLTISHG